MLDHPARVALLAGELVSNRLRARPDLRLILPTGHTPLGLYAALRAHRADGSLPTAGATLFQLDEYLGLPPEDPRSYRAYLHRELGGLGFGAFHGLDGSALDPDAECARHQELLAADRIDLVVLGLGRDGHVAFDEPGSPAGAGVRRVRLHPATRADAAADFGGVDAVPEEALTVGLSTLREARELLMLVTGPAKAEALRAMLEGEQDDSCPASMIRDHPRLTVVADADAAGLLQPPPGRHSDHVLMVLGHREPGVSPDARISDESLARIERAVRTCHADPPRAVLFTGWTRTPDGFSEAEQMEEAWPLAEVPALLEEAGRNTAENAFRSLPIIHALGGMRRVTVVTSASHLRAPYFFAPYRGFGLDVTFAHAYHRRWARMFAGELVGFARAKRQRRAAHAALRLPPVPSLGAG